MFRVSTVWWFYKRAKPFPSSLVFLEFLVLRVASIVLWDFLEAHSGHYTAIIYIRFHYFFSIHFQYMRISSQPPLVHYIFMYVCASIFWLFSFYLWLVLVFLFSRISYECTPLQHCMSRHYTSRQCNDVHTRCKLEIGR